MNRHLALLLTVIMVFSCAAPVAAIPSGPVIVAGSVVTISGLGTNETVVLVGAPGGGSRAAINWAWLNVETGESLIFRDGTGSGNFAVLNRVTSGMQTHITGTIKTQDSGGNDAQVGQVFIVNPYGFNIDSGAHINCGAITLSALDTDPATFVNSPNKPIVFTTGAALGTSGDIVFMAGTDTRALNYIAVLGAGQVDIDLDMGTRNIIADPNSGTLLLAQANSITLNVADPAKIGYSGVTSCVYAGFAYFSSARGGYEAIMQADKIINIVDNNSATGSVEIGNKDGISATGGLFCHNFELYYGNANSTLSIYDISNHGAAMTQFRYIGAPSWANVLINNPAQAASFGYGEVYDNTGGVYQLNVAALQAGYDYAKGVTGFNLTSTDSGYRAVITKDGYITQGQDPAQSNIPGGNWSFEAQDTYLNNMIILMNKGNYFSGLAVNGAAGGAGFFNADTATTGLTVHTSALTGAYSAPDHAGLYLTSLGNITQDGPIYAPYLYAVSSKINGTVTLTNAANDISHEFDVYLRNSGSHALSYTNVAGGGLNVKRITADSGAVTVTANQNINLDSSGGLAPASLSVIANDRTSGGMIVQNAITVNSAILTTNDLTLQAPNITTQGTLTSQNGRVMLWNNNEYSNIQVNAQITSNANSGFNRAAIVLNGGNGPVSVGNLTLLRCNRFDSSLSATPYIAIFGDGSQAIPDEWFNMTFADITSFSGQINSSAPTDYGITYRNLWGHL